MTKKIKEKEEKMNIHRIMNILRILILIIRKNLGILGVLILIVSGTYYLFYTDTEIEYHDYVSFSGPETNSPDYYILISSVTKNEFIVGQPIHIEAYILFTDNQSYNNFEKNTETIILIVSGASPIEANNWFIDSVILISETNEPLREELKVPFITDKYLKGETDIIFHQSGIHEIYTFSNGTKVPISKITISPRTVGYELKSNKWTAIFALIGIVLAFLSLFKKKN